MSARIGVYVHFPWCLRKCPYCDFVSFALERDALDHRGYADAVLGELAARRALLGGRTVDTVFFGGGTPSLWEPEELGRVLAGIRSAADVFSDEAEITVECNPTSLDEERARRLRAVGVNRLSVGVQSLDAGRLAFLGRLHDVAGGLAALQHAVAAGIERVSGDLIYGVAGSRPTEEGGDGPHRAQSPEDAAAEAVSVAATGVGHVSAYGLTIEGGTRFGELARQKRLPIATDDAAADAFQAVDEALESRGLVHYEISNFARPGEEARHNLGYWRGDDYLGLGCAAFGTHGVAGGDAVRWRNFVEPERYQTAAASGRSVEASREHLDGPTRLRERIFLGLRLRQGFDLECAAEALGVPAWTDDRRRAAERLVSRGRLLVEGPRLRVPRPAWIFSDGIAAELF